MPTSTHTTHVRFYDTLRQICHCPTGGQRRPPLQNVVRFCRKCAQFCDCVPPGRARHRPLRTYYVVAVWLCDFVIAFCAGGAEPLSYGSTWNAQKTGRRSSPSPDRFILLRPSFSSSFAAGFVLQPRSSKSSRTRAGSGRTARYRASLRRGTPATPPSRP